MNGKLKDEELVALRSSVGWDNKTGSFSNVRKGLYAHFTARLNKRLIGFLDILSDGFADAFIQDLIVHPDLQGKGLGKDLMKSAIRFLQKKKIKCIQVTFENHLLPFYKKLGFHIFSAGIIDRDTMKVKL